MAIQGTYVFSGISVPGAIAAVQIITLRAITEPTQMISIVDLFAGQAERVQNNPFSSQSYTQVYDPSGGDAFQQVYTYLLTLPEYDGWIEIP